LDAKKQLDAKKLEWQQNGISYIQVSIRMKNEMMNINMLTL
jgi:hypothetical protein